MGEWVKTIKMASFGLIKGKRLVVFISGVYLQGVTGYIKKMI